MAKFDRVTTGTTRVVQSIETLLSKPGIKLDGKNKQGEDLLQITTTDKAKGNIVKIDYLPEVKDAKLQKIWEGLAKQYGLVDGPYKEKNYMVVRIGTEDAERNVKDIRFQQIAPASGGNVIPTNIQEKATTIVFNQALIKNVSFDKEEDIKNHPETRKLLLECFGKNWDHRLDDWTWTFFQQQKQFLKEYKGAKWGVFEYHKQDLVHFFSTEIQQVARDLDPFVPAGKYTTWNPADIFAAYDMPAIKQKIETEIKRKEPITQTLVELNNILVGLMEKKKLVGISLKKVTHGNQAEIHLHNVESSSILKFEKLEKYVMKDIKFSLKNIFVGDKVLCTIKLGSGDDYSINITRTSGGTLSFNTAIKRTPAAQGGQAPIDMVVALLNGGDKFSKDKNAYRMRDLTTNKTKKAEYEKMYNFVSEKHFKLAPKFNTWAKDIVYLFATDERVAQAKLAMLSFFYDAIVYSEKQKDKAEFWTDLLYLGMKVSPKGHFAPHAKIS
tara:strand:+ start:606 stop:2096 length:1491 start_codon:yes stop_codon:yes gene_type:complete